MKHTKEEIINALKVIKEECAGQVCEKCPFGGDGGKCKLVNDSPDNWAIDEGDGIWRALR